MEGDRLVTLTHPRGIAAVVRQPSGDAWLVGDLHRGGATRLEDLQPAVQGLHEDVTLAGGLLPPGAVSALVLDRAGREHRATCGAHAWLVLLPEPADGEAPPVRFFDAHERLVAVPLPGGVALEHVADATEPCPACGAADWGRVVAAPPWRYGHDGSGRPTGAVCRRCGYEESIGVMYAPLDPDAAPDPAALEQARMEATRAWTAEVRTATFPLFRLTAGDPVVGGFGGHGDGVHSVDLIFGTPDGPVSITTDVDEPFESTEWQARRALEELVDRFASWPDRSATAVMLWLSGRRRAAARTVAASPAQRLDIDVDGSPVPFLLISAEQHYAAVARIGAATVTITGSGTPTALSLETMSATDL